MMIRLIKNEWKKLRLTVIGTITIISIVACVLSCTLYKNYSLNYDLEAWEVGTELIGFLFPLIVVIPICWNMYYERENNFLLYTMPRVNKSKYLIAKWIISAISAFLILLVPYFLAAVFALYVKHPIETYIPEDMSLTPFNHVFLVMFMQKPLLYAFLLSCWKGFIGIFVMSLGFILSLYVDNIFVILTGPFIYFILENFILAILGLEEYRLVTAFEPTSIEPTAITGSSFTIGLLLISLVTLAGWFYFSKIKRIPVYKV